MFWRGEVSPQSGYWCVFAPDTPSASPVHRSTALKSRRVLSVSEIAGAPGVSALPIARAPKKIDHIEAQDGTEYAAPPSTGDTPVTPPDLERWGDELGSI